MPLCCFPFTAFCRKKSAKTSFKAGRVKMVVVGNGQCGKTSLIQRYCSGTLPQKYIPTLFDTSTLTTSRKDTQIQLVIQDMAGQEDLQLLRPPFYLHTDVIIICFAQDNLDSLDNVLNVWVPEVRRNCGRRVPILLVVNKTDLGVGCVFSDAMDRVHVDARDGNTNAEHSPFSPADETVHHRDVLNLECASTPSSNKTCHSHINGQGANLNSQPKQVELDGRQSRCHCTLQDVKGLGVRTSGQVCGCKRSQRPHNNTCLQEGQNLAAKIGAVCYMGTSAVLNVGVTEVFETALSAAMSSKQWRKKQK